MFNAIHIFSFGDVQYLSDSLQYIAKHPNLTTLQDIIDEVKSKKPLQSIDEPFSTINIFPDRVSYNAKKNSSYSFAFSELDSTKVNAFISEIQNLSVSKPTPHPDVPFLNT